MNTDQATVGQTISVNTKDELPVPGVVVETGTSCRVDVLRHDPMGWHTDRFGLRTGRRTIPLFFACTRRTSHESAHAVVGTCCRTRSPSSRSKNALYTTDVHSWSRGLLFNIQYGKSPGGSRDYVSSSGSIAPPFRPGPEGTGWILQVSSKTVNGVTTRPSDDSASYIAITRMLKPLGLRASDFVAPVAGLRPVSLELAEEVFAVLSRHLFHCDSCHHLLRPPSVGSFFIPPAAATQEPGSRGGCQRHDHHSHCRRGRSVTCLSIGRAILSANST